MHSTSEMLITCAPMLAACTIARAIVWTKSIFCDVCGSSSPVYGSFRPKALLDWRIEIMSTSGAMPLKASVGPGAAVVDGGGGGGGDGGCLGVGLSGRGLAGLSTVITRPPPA